MPIVVGNINAAPVEGRLDPQHMGIFTWTIEEYSSYDNKRVIHSPTFEKGGFSWRLWLFPKGSVNATEGDMSIFLHYIKKDDVFSVEPIDHPRAKFSIKINNQLEGEDVLHEIYDFHSFAESNGEWGWKDFAEIERLFEEDSGLVLNGVLKVELHLFVRPKTRSLWPVDDSEEARTVVLRVLTDQQIKKEIGTIHFTGLPMFEEGKSYCFYEQMQYSNFQKLVGRDHRLNADDLRFWLCEQLPHGQLRIVQNLSSSSTRLERISDLAELKKRLLPSVTDSQSLESINIYVEAPNDEEEVLKELNAEEDFVAFCKFYDPWVMQLWYVGTIPLRKGCKPAEVIVDARMLAGMDSRADVSLYIEAPPNRDSLHELSLEDTLDVVTPLDAPLSSDISEHGSGVQVGLRPGCTVIVQPKVDPAYAAGKEMRHPTVRTFLRDTDRPRSPYSESSQASHVKTEPHDDVCVICFERPRTVGFLHGDSLHRCVCRRCAPQIVKDDSGTCPLCRKKIDRVIMNIF